MKRHIDDQVEAVADADYHYIPRDIPQGGISVICRVCSEPVISAVWRAVGCLVVVVVVKQSYLSSCMQPEWAMTAAGSP